MQRLYRVNMPFRRTWRLHGDSGLAQSTHYPHWIDWARGVRGRPVTIGYPPMLSTLRVPTPAHRWRSTVPLPASVFGHYPVLVDDGFVGAVDEWLYDPVALLQMTVRLFAAVLVIGVFAAVACNGTGMPTSSVDDSTFVHTMIDLQRLADDSTLDSLMRDSTRRVILRQHGLTADELVRAARAMASDPDRAVRVWTAISNGRTPGGLRTAPRIPSTPGSPRHIGTPSGPSRP